MTHESHRVAVCSPVAQLFAEPHVASAQISQLLAGRVAEVLEARDDWYRVRGPDDYEGWMHRGYVTSVPDERHAPQCRDVAHLARLRDDQLLRLAARDAARRVSHAG